MRGRDLLCSAAIVWSVGTSARATVDTVIRGSVRDELLAPVASADVRLYDRRGRLLRSTTTDAQGQFSFAGVAFGEYEVRAKAEGRAETKQRVQPSSAEAAEVDL
ncbi:MAG TPA: carboxypeptidase-like regulatory domain-containing protein, partial [Pseudomonadota bacterium]|nr:carboxypeptidase-like regulatory domain-containing protein [Pseudomonadota bacterium]